MRALQRLVGTLIALALACCACASAQDRSSLQSREALRAHLEAFSTNNGEREQLIRKYLSEDGCSAANLSEQEFDRKLPPNVICVLRGETSEVIIVGAHTDHVDTAGDGVVDNWTGAVLLPALLYDLRASRRHHTFVFVGFSAEEKGLVGSQYYAEHLMAERSRIDAMVNFDSLGLGPTEVWSSHADRSLVEALERVAAGDKLPLSTMNPENGASADSESFAHYHVSSITLHSVTESTWSVLHSPRDKMGAIKFDDYYGSYRLIADYLAYLDRTLKVPSGQH
jgi:Iap family predicted aminopeptidase